MKRRDQLVFVSALAISLAGAGRAATINVPGDEPTIQDAVEAASSGDVIVVQAGTWDGFAVNDLVSVPDLTIRSVDPNDPAVVTSTIIDTPSSIDLFDTTVSGLTFADVSGAALSTSDDSNVTISNCSFANNTATTTGILSAGAITSFQGFLKVVNCSFIGNTGDQGGAIGLFNAELEVVASTFIDNEGTSGGAISSCTPIFYVTVDDCTFQGNAAGAGGALYLEGSDVFVVRNSVFTDNTSTSGGAVFATFDAEVAVSTTTMKANTATSGGGALFADGFSTITIDEASVLCANEPDPFMTASGGAVVGSPFAGDYCPPPSFQPPLTPPLSCLADISGRDGVPDGSVGFADLTKLLNDWGACPDC